ncbi:hypothetical protein TNIN_452461 [Trichonephila inaurata madagascariensis]|uniref:Uncharacterized protein n=1 Tax=Trichonephila inaurata madagascariensis TaxID=2747483 RepID=A0A8X6KLH8_9ARAC|nr:hypothetical protein TNIN_452461 [Trichonephila inaurata madagascariensis]
MGRYLLIADGWATDCCCGFTKKKRTVEYPIIPSNLRPVSNNGLPIPGPPGVFYVCSDEKDLISMCLIFLLKCRLEHVVAVSMMMTFRALVETSASKIACLL